MSHPLPLAGWRPLHLPLREIVRCRDRLIAALALMRARRSQRRALARLDDHLLRDIGISAEQARRESGKPFWRA
jgi:uncharacterized protein YjiS (DUF1127 family)